MSAHRLRGVTLIELVVYIVVIAVGLAGVLSAFNASVRQSADPLIWKQALLVAEAMMSEILGKDFQSQPNDAGRANFNDVGDYDRYFQNGITQADGTAVAALADYGVNVSVVPSALSSIAAADARQVTVTVSHGNLSVSLTGFRTNYGL